MEFERTEETLALRTILTENTVIPLYVDIYSIAYKYTIEYLIEAYMKFKDLDVCNVVQVNTIKELLQHENLNNTVIIVNDFIEFFGIKDDDPLPLKSWFDLNILRGSLKHQYNNLLLIINTKLIRTDDRMHDNIINSIYSGLNSAFSTIIEPEYDCIESADEIISSVPRDFYYYSEVEISVNFRLLTPILTTGTTSNLVTVNTIHWNTIKNILNN